MLSLLLLSMLGVLFVFGVTLMLLELRKAPEGTEDIDGFHVLQRDTEMLAPIPVKPSRDPRAVKLEHALASK